MVFHALGLMSGTSIDGLDICYAGFEKKIDEASWQFQILKTETIPYPRYWQEILRNAIHLSAEEICALHSEFGFYLGETTNRFIDTHQITNLHVIASHGHTVFHQPQKRFTLQIGDGRAIRLQNNFPVVYDFRSQDVLLGGNGAPLVPIGDRLLFGDFDACLNVGGFSNISFEKEDKRIAFDICPVNTVLNHFAQKCNQEFDESGRLAKSGTVNQEIIIALNSLEYYKAQPPKSLGIEWVNEEIFPLLANLAAHDALATFTEHISTQISAVFQEHSIKNVLVTGGGAYNTHLMDLINQKSQAECVLPSHELISSKEALIFAFMGLLRFLGHNNVLASTTGSAEDHCTGLLLP